MPERTSELREQRDAIIRIADIELMADAAGALVWPEERLVVVSDLHLEKGSSFAARGTLLPPYDSAATLAQLVAVIARHDPRVVIALGDSFHDRHAHERLSVGDRDTLAALQSRRDWIWIAGNHDPAPPVGLGGIVATQIVLGALSFRHEPTGARGEISGHLHPYARVPTRGRAISRRCFAADGERIVMPAFGAYAGGLNIRDRAFAAILQMKALTAHLLGDRRLHVFPVARCYG
jgi:DNA ligase-associated metallophosphoesterase